MLDDDRLKLKGTIGLLDQAIAPLKNAEIVIGEIVLKEKELLNGGTPITSEDEERFSKLADLGNRYKSIHNMVEYLNQCKDFLEKF